MFREKKSKNDFRMIIARQPHSDDVIGSPSAKSYAGLLAHMHETLHEPPALKTIQARLSHLR